MAAEAAGTFNARARPRSSAGGSAITGWSDKLLSLAGSSRRGPCRGPATVLFVNSEDDFQKRLSYGSTQMVEFRLKRSITLNEGLVLNSSWSCTIITSSPPGGYGLFSPSKAMAVPLIAIIGANNVLIRSLSSLFLSVSSSSPPCAKGFPDFGEAQDSVGVTCPALFIYKSWGVQVASAQVRGRIDVFRSLFVKLDNLQVTMPKGSYSSKIPHSDFRNRGLIRVAYTMPGWNVPPRTILITNNELFGHWELVSLYKGAAGVTVRNNYMHDFEFTAVRCGADDDYVFDCHHNVIGWNLIQNPGGFKENSANAGIYLRTRWFNPQLHLVCNYIINQKRCIHLDFASSGVQVSGGLCSDADVGVLVTNGKSNLVMYMIATNIKNSLAVVSCELASNVNWLAGTRAKNWEGLRRKNFDMSVVNKEGPYMKAMCNPKVPWNFWGKTCNPTPGLSAQQTGFCSGLPLDNRIEVWGYKTTKKHTPNYYKCSNLPASQTINVNRWVNASAPKLEAGFLDPSKMDFGVKGKSQAYRMRPFFRSCPRSMVGIVKPSGDQYEKDFNIALPSKMFSRVLNLLLSIMTDPTIIAK